MPRARIELARRLCLVALALGLAAAAASPPPEVLARQAAEYRAQVPKSVLELQQFRTTTSVPFEVAGSRPGTATLINLNPYVGAWYLLTVDTGQPAGRRSFHLENPRPTAQTVTLLGGDPGAVRLAIGDRGAPCTLRPGDRDGALEGAVRSDLAYAPLCDGRLYLRNAVAGHRTSLERMAEFLREHVWGGEQVIGFVKEEFYHDAFLEQPALQPGAGTIPAATGHRPKPAAIDAASAGSGLVPAQLGLDVAAPGRELTVGQWYPIRDAGGVALSVVVPKVIDRSILSARQPSVNALGPVESEALVYMVSFDLDTLDPHFVLGTDHPRLDWSPRPPATMRDMSLPGPDGIDRPAPLVTNGMVSPAEVRQTVATFTGGFKREHGAFSFGRLAQQNHGSHYGFIEQGVVFSKLQPGLATVFATDDGAVRMKTWAVTDDALLPHIRFARQNGVPLIDYDATLGLGVPGLLVNSWAQGNWSGSAKEDLRTLRAGLCLQSSEAGRYLIYGYFSDATPSAMARVFQAYHCQYALHLDMNALEHTYLALYVTHGSQRVVEHLIRGMDVLDQQKGNTYSPRFLSFPDNRDFFFMTKKGGAP
ncbi:MAG TPA: hypothetical protein VMT50_10275 [Steroidobacteraceae bacterium]|nr:hypothetical protein [Steroidobacteraceae bacterium]